MDKSEMMKRYEAETGKDRPTVNIYSLIDWYEAFSAWLESKAEAYDSLMSGGLKTIIKTIKEFISTIPDSDVWWCPNCGETECSADGRCVNCGLYIDTPDIEAEKIKNTFTLLLDSLTLPDGWEEK